MGAMLNSLVRVCGTPNPPGTEAKIYYCKKGELNSWPATVAAGGGTAPGDTKKLAGDFSFIASGYLRTADILMDSGALKNLLEGELGGQGFKSEVSFFVLGTEAEQLEFADCMAAYSGCLIAMIKTKSGSMHVIGTIDSPVAVSSGEMNTGAKNGDKSGTAYTLYASTGYTSSIYSGALKLAPTAPGAIPTPGASVKADAEKGKATA